MDHIHGLFESNMDVKISCHSVLWGYMVEFSTQFQLIWIGAMLLMETLWCHPHHPNHPRHPRFFSTTSQPWWQRATPSFLTRRLSGCRHSGAAVPSTPPFESHPLPVPGSDTAGFPSTPPASCQAFRTSAARCRYTTLQRRHLRNPGE